jgi:30S ribosome assembly GTPase
MIKKCLGCGVTLQNSDTSKIGYIKDLEKNNCERCFRIRHYGDYKQVTKTNNEFISVLQTINKTNDLVLVVADLFSLPKDFEDIMNNISNPKLLVLNKRDLFASDIYNEKFLRYITGDFIEKILISSLNNFNLDNLMGLINKYKKSKSIYVIGYTNAGKSTLINKMLYNYSDHESTITTSILPSTTLDMIEIKLNDNLTIYDTPGLLDQGNIINYVDGNSLKNIIPNKVIRPISYRINALQYLIIDKYALVELDSSNVTLFFSNNLNIDRVFKKPDISFENVVEIEAFDEDIVISGLGFIKVTGKSKVIIQTYKDVNIYKRKSMI